MNSLLRGLMKLTHSISVRNMSEHIVIINVNPNYGGYYRLSKKTHSSQGMPFHHLLETQAVKVKKGIYCKVFGLIANYLSKDAKVSQLIMVV